METKSGWRATPAPLLIAFGTWFIYLMIRLVTMHAMTFEYGYSPRLRLIGEGLNFACGLLILLGAIELMNRVAGPTRSMLKIAVAGAALSISADVLAGFVQFSKSPWDHKWIYDAYEYSSIASMLMIAIGLALALPPARRAFGFIVVAVTFVSWMPPIIADKVWSALSLEGKSLYTVHTLLSAVRVVMVGLLCTKVAEGVTTSQPMVAAEGFRLAAKGLWLRVIAACVVVMLTLMMIAGKGGEGSLSFFKLIMMTQAIVSVIALLMTGLGALRVARSGATDLEPYILTLGGGASLWAAGVSLTQLPMIYKAFYGGGDFSGREMREMTEILAIALPVVVIVGVGLLATALSGFGARRGDEELRTDAQGKGIGYVVLMLVAIAIQNWMLPKSRSIGNFAMLSLLAAGASVWGTVMIAKLLGRGAEALESDPGLPPASLHRPD